MQGLPRSSDPDLLIGFDHFSDAGVYRLADGLAVVQTLDFFSPLVDDPYTFGQIAAANSLSDVYAMGGRVRTAMNIVCFPDDQLDLSVLHEILRGGAERIEAAGGVIVGGHSIRDNEIKYGLSVTGTVDPARMFTNDRARPGQVIILTKGLGTGFITTANRAGRCPPEVLEAACASMIQLNKDGAECGHAVAATAVTDITGFGLAGHAMQMAQASAVTLAIELARLPILTGALKLARQGNLTRANATNRQHCAASMRFAERSEGDQSAEFLFDPQTSGGLLVAVEADRADDFVKRCLDSGLESVAIIGKVAELGETHLVIH